MGRTKEMGACTRVHGGARKGRGSVSGHIGFIGRRMGAEGLGMDVCERIGNGCVRKHWEWTCAEGLGVVCEEGGFQEFFGEDI